MIEVDDRVFVVQPECLDKVLQRVSLIPQSDILQLLLVYSTNLAHVNTESQSQRPQFQGCNFVATTTAQLV